MRFTGHRFTSEVFDLHLLQERNTKAERVHTYAASVCFTYTPT